MISKGLRLAGPVSLTTRCLHRARFAVAALLVVALVACKGDSQQQSTPSDASRLLSLRGRVVFRIPDREALVLPTGYLSPQERGKPVPRISNFTLCVHLPEFSFHGDESSRRECLATGERGGAWAVLDVYGTDNPVTPPADLSRTSLGRNLLARLTQEGQGVGAAADIQVYRRGDEQFGLHAYYPTNFAKQRTAASLFWAGPDEAAARTFIECIAYLPTQESRLHRCVHAFELPAADVGGLLVRVRLFYPTEWLARWQEMETTARGAVLALRHRLPVDKEQR